MKRILNLLEYYLAVHICLGAGLFFVFWYLNRPILEPESNTYRVEGKLKEYSFKGVKGYRESSKQYYLWLDDFPCTFQIKADFLSFFKQNSFEHEVKLGNQISFILAKDDQYKLLNEENKVFVYSIFKKDSIFLDFNLSKKEEESYFKLFTGLGFLIAGIVLFHYLRKRRCRMRVKYK